MRSLAPIPIVAGFLAAFVACADSPKGPLEVGSPDFATATTEQTIIPLTFLLANPCTGEAVQGSTRLHTKVHATIQPDGSSNFELEVNTQNTQAQALVTGAKYVVTEEQSVTEQDIPPGTTFTDEFSFHMIRSGEGGLVADDDFMVHLLIHFTVNANGTLTVSHLDFRAECM